MSINSLKRASPVLLVAAAAAFPCAALAQGGTTTTSNPFGSVTVQGQPNIVATVSTLPPCNATTKGFDNYYVTDATTPTYNGALTGGGAVVVPVFCNGTAWTSH